jgi:hypothetical protein
VNVLSFTPTVEPGLTTFEPVLRAVAPSKIWQDESLVPASVAVVTRAGTEERRTSSPDCDASNTKFAIRSEEPPGVIDCEAGDVAGPMMRAPAFTVIVFIENDGNAESEIELPVFTPLMFVQFDDDGSVVAMYVPPFPIVEATLPRSV